MTIASLAEVAETARHGIDISVATLSVFRAQSPATTSMYTPWIRGLGLMYFLINSMTLSNSTISFQKFQSRMASHVCTFIVSFI